MKTGLVREIEFKAYNLIDRMDQLEDTYGGTKALNMETSLCLRAPMDDLLIDELDAKEPRLFDSNPDASYDIRTLTTDLNNSGMPTPVTKISHQAFSSQD